MTVGEAQGLIRANGNPRPETVTPDKHPSPEEMARAVKADLGQELFGATPEGPTQTQAKATVIPFGRQGAADATRQARPEAAPAAPTAPKPAPRRC